MSEFEEEIKIQQNNKSRDNRDFFKGFILGILSVLLITSIGFLVIIKLNNTTTVKREFNVKSKLDDKELFQKKTEILKDTIDKYFYLDEVSDEELYDGMYKGLINSLNDPYSEYYTEEELARRMEDSEGIYYGIGAYISLDTKTSIPKISSVISGAPAEAVDLRADDLIYEVDGESTYGMSLTEVVSMIKGEEDTEVVLTIVRSTEDDYLYKTVVRKKVESPTVQYEMLDDEMGYIEITEFDDVTTDQFADALATVKGSGMKGLILDLRGNPGGNLSTVVNIARMLLPEGLIVYTENKAGEKVEYTCDGKKQLDVPLVVLIDSNSASASEILSGAIKDYGIGTLVGTTTFGKGIVQQIIPFTDGSAVKITVSAYYTPKGKNIHGIGIEPDIECEFDGELYYDTEEHTDNQLEKAKEVLSDMIK